MEQKKTAPQKQGAASKEQSDKRRRCKEVLNSNFKSKQITALHFRESQTVYQNRDKGDYR